MFEPIPPTFYGFPRRRKSRKTESPYRCYVCGKMGRAKNMSIVPSANPFLEGGNVAVHKGLCLEKYHRRYG